MRLAQWGTYLGNGLDIWQTKGKFSRTDRYEAHLDLDKLHMTILTNKRIMMLQKSSDDEMELVSQPSSVLWALEWTNLLDVELPDMALRSQRGKASPSRYTSSFVLNFFEFPFLPWGNLFQALHH